jgi:DNA helicase-2/ATP-dependent DNA helicase PcrA
MSDAFLPGFIPRPAQAKILEYSGGPMGVSAVPGSGKTFTLSLLAARLVERLADEGRLEDREVLVVTFTNSAVENFRHRIARFLRQERGLLPSVGYRVRTLHGLAHDIVRERPSLVGLSEDFDIIDERTASEIKREASLAYLRSNPDVFASYIQPNYLQNSRSYERYLIDDAIDLANAIIRTAKEEGGEAHEWIALLRNQSGTWPLLDFGLHIYADYQRSLFLRGAVDFDDLIVFALRALENDEHYLARLQERWPYILEDEAQDSSLLQEKMLRRLTAGHGNWVRVGDPNQAINTTFTGADTRFLQRFLADHPEQARDLPNSGRSALPIIRLANALIDWSRLNHPVLGADLALSPPFIEPTALDDPQPNPAPGDPPIHLFDRSLTPEQEIKIIATSLQRWLPQHQEMTVAALVPENSHGFKLTDALEELGVPFDDSLLRSDSATRAGAQALAIVAAYIAQPQNQVQLEAVWRDVWWPLIGQRQLVDRNGEASSGVRRRRQRQRKIVLPAPINDFGGELRKLRTPESFLFPSASDWLDHLPWLAEIEGMQATVERFRGDMQRWAAAAILPIDELLLTLGNDLFDEPVDLALTHRLAVLMAKLARENPTWRLPELAGELENIAQNKRRILGFSEEAGGYEAEAGVVTVGTMHAAKGLEWDRVYLLAVNNFGFPSGGEDDKYRSERFYVRDRLNLLAEAQAQLHQLRGGTLDDYLPEQATVNARLDLAAERLRLLYVGVTRARRELIITYNTGRNPEKDPNRPALALQALMRLTPTSSST